MIVFDHVSVQYTGAPAPTLREVDLTVHEGEFALVAGRTGVGKSTLLGAVNGLVPHFTGGTLTGRVVVGGLDTRDHPPRELAHLVGVVGQDPAAGFVTDTVEEELAYGMEQLGVKPSVMRTRVEETLDLLGIAELRNRPLRTLSGGQQQRVAIGSVLAAGARVLVLDEPTSALDPTSAEEVLAALLRLVHDLGVTALVAEHRMERVVEYADRVVLLPGGGLVVSGEPGPMMARSELVPPLVELGRLAGWDPLPLSVRDARRRVGDLRSRLLGTDPSTVPARVQVSAAAPESSGRRGGLQADRIVVSYGRVTAVRDVSIDIPAGTVAVLMGRNGSGKSSLLWALTGVGPRAAGRVAVAGEELSSAGVERIRGKLRLVPQTASDLLYLETVGAECTTADHQAERPAGTCRALLDRLAPGIPDDRHPRDLSEGQRLALVLAVQLTADPPVLLLDEPTRGLDYRAKAHLADILHGLAADGRTVVVSTHDVEFAAGIADQVLVMATGDLITTGTAEQVLGSSAALAPQVAKVLSPQRWLTVAQVRRALQGSDR